MAQPKKASGMPARPIAWTMSAEPMPSAIVAETLQNGERASYWFFAIPESCHRVEMGGGILQREGPNNDAANRKWGFVSFRSCNLDRLPNGIEAGAAGAGRRRRVGRRVEGE